MSASNVSVSTRVRVRRFIAAGVVLSGAVTFGAPGLTRPAAAEGGAITGIAFEDRNANGVKESTDSPLANITVDVAGDTAAFSLKTGADGTSSVAVPPGTHRIEFSGQPKGMFPAPVGQAGAAGAPVN